MRGRFRNRRTEIIDSEPQDADRARQIARAVHRPRSCRRLASGDQLCIVRQTSLREGSKPDGRDVKRHGSREPDRTLRAHKPELDSVLHQLNILAGLRRPAREQRLAQHGPDIHAAGSQPGRRRQPLGSDRVQQIRRPGPSFGQLLALDLVVGIFKTTAEFVRLKERLVEEIRAEALKVAEQA